MRRGGETSRVDLTTLSQVSAAREPSVICPVGSVGAFLALRETSATPRLKPSDDGRPRSTRCVRLRAFSRRDVRGRLYPRTKQGWGCRYCEVLRHSANCKY